MGWIKKVATLTETIIEEGVSYSAKWIVFPKIFVYLHVKKNGTMPRKENGIPFELHPSPQKDKQGCNLLYAIPMQNLSATLEELDEQCCMNSGLPRHQLVSTFIFFMTAAADYLANGKRIVTPMGTFTPRLQLKRQLTRVADVRADDVEWRGVEFQPSKAFMQQVVRRSRGFHLGPTSKLADKKPTDKQLQRALRQSLSSNNGQTTVSIFMVYSGLTNYSARHYLDGLCSGEHPQLQRHKLGSSFVYQPVKA